MNRGPSHLKHSDLVFPLLDWFAKNARDLPWRRTSDPYAVWISEIMLQQTQVKTVVPFWNRWMKNLPTIQSLALARPEKLLKLWEGLGYYTRARNLQKAAQKICREHGGAFPRDFDAILELPGIGPYTAGAIASIAFNDPKPILDGNVIRVLTRVFGIETDPREKETNARLWKIAGELVVLAARFRSPVRNAVSHFNQSLMELGALVCIPRQPKCLACPLRKSCVAFRENKTNSIPNLAKRAAPTQRRFLAFIVENKGSFLVRQRSTKGVNARLWEFPNFEPAARNGFGAPFEIPGRAPLCTIKHSITRYRITLDVFHSSADDWKKADGKWLSLEQLQKLAFPSAHRRILQFLTSQLRNGR